MTRSTDQWVEGKVVDNRHWNERLYSLRIDAPIKPFAAGQFARLALNINGERVARPYSHVGAPHDDIRAGRLCPTRSNSKSNRKWQPGGTGATRDHAGQVASDDLWKSGYG